MKIKPLMIAGMVLAASSAQGATIAGWDFSQYVNGFLSTDGATLTGGTLPANWADLDTGGLLPGLGAGSEAFGTLNLGFTPTGADPVSPLAAPLAGGSLGANNDTPAAGVMDFTSQASLQADGQFLWNDLALRVGSALDLVFEVTLSSLSQIGNGWGVQFAGQTESLGVNSSIDVSLSTDGLSFGPVQTIGVDQADALKVVGFGTEGDGAASVFVKFAFDGTPVYIDNVTVLATAGGATVTPEPGTALLAAAGMFGMLVFGRRK